MLRSSQIIHPTKLVSSCLGNHINKWRSIESQASNAQLQRLGHPLFLVKGWETPWVDRKVRNLWKYEANIIELPSPQTLLGIFLGLLYYLLLFKSNIRKFHQLRTRRVQQSLGTLQQFHSLPWKTAHLWMIYPLKNMNESIAMSKKTRVQPQRLIPKDNWVKLGSTNNQQQ